MFKYLSSSLFLAVLLFIGIGLVQVYSSSFIFATESYGDGLYFFKRQLMFSLFAIGVMVVTIHTPFQWIEKWGWSAWFLAIGLLILTFVPGLGVRVGGALRWIQLPFGLRFEPSEFLKIAFSIFFASLITRKQNFLQRVHPILLFIFLFLPFLLLLKQPDFGSFAIISIVGLGLLFAFGLPWKYIIGLVVVSLPAFYLLVMRVPYRRARVMSFLDPWSDPAQKGFQAIQSMLSFQSGGLTGVGLGNGQGKLFFLPEAHTDFTLAVLGEEMGFIGFLLILILYGIIVFKGVQIAIKQKDNFRKAMVLGLVFTFALSVFINSGVVMGLLPTKGLTLPFLSYGGSSLVVLCFMFGLILNIENNTKEDRITQRFQKIIKN